MNLKKKEVPTRVSLSGVVFQSSGKTTRSRLQEIGRKWRLGITRKPGGKNSYRNRTSPRRGGTHRRKTVLGKFEFSVTKGRKPLVTVQKRIGQKVVKIYHNYGRRRD